MRCVWGRGREGAMAMRPGVGQGSISFRRYPVGKLPQVAAGKTQQEKKCKENGPATIAGCKVSAVH